VICFFFIKICNELICFSFCFLGLFLSPFNIFVGVNGYASKPFKQESGVPQGSVLGPLFFNIFINDLVDDLDVPHLLFIEEISRRCKLNNLVLNHLKCSIVSFTRKTKPLLFDYKINGSILTRCESIRDLGVIFDSKLSFGEHIRTIAGTAFRALGFVLRAGRKFSDVTTLKLLYITYVRSRLEYASLVWSPIYDVHSSLLERVQRRFLKNVVFMLNGAYPPRGCPQGLLLGEVGLQSLLDRRMEHSVIFLFKLFRGLQECPHVLERISLRVSRSGSRVRSVFYIGQRHTDIGLKSPVTRMLRNYQSVEAHIDIFCCSISQIKKFFSISS
jgi:ribonuclease P/MRP protein subunit RPP40